MLGRKAHTVMGGVLTIALSIPVLQGTRGAASSSKASGSKGLPRPIVQRIPQPREELKMVLCVNTSLGMGKGKIGAQCAHAAVGVLQKYKSRHEVAFKQWEMFGQPKITLKVKDETEMAHLAQAAGGAGLPWYIVHDAGRTQIAAGSQTVLAIGPGPASQVNSVTGKLSLL